MVLCRPRRADAKNGDKNCQMPTASRENAIRKYQYLNFPIPFLNFSEIMT
jgi:hypothetical protein